MESKVQESQNFYNKSNYTQDDEEQGFITLTRSVMDTKYKVPSSILHEVIQNKPEPSRGDTSANIFAKSINKTLGGKNGFRFKS